MPLLLVLALSCSGPDREPRDQSVLLAVEETETWKLPGLNAPAWVVRTEGDIPHIYASDREDLARIQGFVLARHRFVEMDLARRLATGQLSKLLGDAALSSDMESRGIAMTAVCDRLDSNLSDEHARIAEAFAEGVNAYIAQVRAGELPPPSEYELFAPYLGMAAPTDLMYDFDRRSVVAIGATLIYNLGFETGDVGLQDTLDQLDGFYDGAPLADLRQAGLIADIWEAMEPVKPVASAHGWGLEDESGPPPAPRARRSGKKLPRELADRMATRFAALEERLGHDHEKDAWGSNAWAVMGTKSTDGRALIAGDGHLPLSVPSLFYTMGMDTSVLGGGDITQVGVVFPGLPLLAVGTNGKVAWGQTQLMGDITDWYREEMRLDANGSPVSTVFQGADQPLVRFDETYEIAEIALMDSVGRTETWPRWTTFDGRWIADIEGRSSSPGEVLADGETLVNLQGDWVVPQDLDGDGVITAISFDYTGLDDGNILEAVDGFGKAQSVEDLREATKGLVAYSQNIVAADSSGSILYTGYQAVPCRGYLERDGEGRWTEGSDPSFLLDGTRYGGFTIPITDGKIDESFGADPYQCVVPFDEYPAALDPQRGYVLTANNDPGGMSLDGKLYDDPWYIGGPWTEGYRANDIDRLLSQTVADGTADVASMQEIQGYTDSALGLQLVPLILESAEAAKAAADGAPEAGTAEERLASIWADDAQLQEAADRLEAWYARGCPTPSGVETFYHQVGEGEAEDAVATMIFNVWVGRFVSGSLDDEGLPGVWRGGGSTGRLRLLTKMIESRGPDNARGLVSWNPDTEESAFWDVRSTAPIETSEEVTVRALAEALAWLRTPATDVGVGGFGTDDMAEWTWGYRHYVHFDSLLADFLGSEPTFAFVLDQFAIDADILPIAPNITPVDRRYNLPGYPRQGDNFSIDAANPGLDGTTFDHGSGPVFRMVFALGEGTTTGESILPGGQSGMIGDPHFADQAALWLGNETWPMRLTPEQVAEGAVGREVYLPADPLP